MARKAKGDSRDWTPPRQDATDARGPYDGSERDAEYDAEGYYDPFAAAGKASRPAQGDAPPWDDDAPSAPKARGRKNAAKPAPGDAPPWEDEVPSAPRTRGRKGAAMTKPAPGDMLRWDEDSPSAPKARGKKNAAKPAQADLPHWDDDDAPSAPKSRGRKKASGGTESARAGDAASASARRGRGADERGRVQAGSARTASGRSAARDTRLTLTVLISGGPEDQFDLLCDGRAYGCGYEQPYRFELKLEPGEHELRVRLRHALDREPSEFVPLPLAMLLGNGRRAEYGPYRAVLDARIDISADSRLTVRYALDGRTGRANGLATFACSAGKGLECEVTDASMGTTPRLRRRWLLANYMTLAVVAAVALSVVGLGAYMCVRPGGSPGGGVLVGLIGVALALGCAGIAGEVRTALEGGFAPDVEMPKARRRKPAAPDADAAPGDGDAPASKRGKGRRAQAEPTGEAGDYDGAYDGAGEMDEFEEAGLSTAELSPEQLRAAKRQLMKKLGGREEE